MAKYTQKNLFSYHNSWPFDVAKLQNISFLMKQALDVCCQRLADQTTCTFAKIIDTLNQYNYYSD